MGISTHVMMNGFEFRVLGSPILHWGSPSPKVSRPFWLLLGMLDQYFTYFGCPVLFLKTYISNPPEPS